jgi:hypothetical protein
VAAHPEVAQVTADIMDTVDVEVAALDVQVLVVAGVEAVATETKPHALIHVSQPFLHN